MFLDYFALGLLIFVALVIFYGVIVIHDIPYEIAKERDHPHQDAIHVSGWVSLFTLHTIWPFLWIWATLWRKDRGWGFAKIKEEQQDIHHRVDVLIDQVAALEKELSDIKIAQFAPSQPDSQERAQDSKQTTLASSQTAQQNQEDK